MDTKYHKAANMASELIESLIVIISLGMESTFVQFSHSCSWNFALNIK